jgi:hypothetical protein
MTEYRLGERHFTNEGCEIEIIEYFGCDNCTIKFTNENVLKNITYRTIKTGKIKNPFHPSICNIGYIGIGRYKAHNNKIPTIFYRRWKGMIDRCYNKKQLKRKPTYLGCSVAEEWHNFQVFSEWYEENHNSEIMQGFALDKDILKKGNKIYSSETCCFVPEDINNLFIKPNRKTKSLPQGVSARNGRYRAYLGSSHLGVFDTIEEAFQAYKTAKEEHIKEMADEWKDRIAENVHQAMYNWTIEITD